jgi:hypothetical protein
MAEVSSYEIYLGNDLIGRSYLGEEPILYNPRTIIPSFNVTYLVIAGGAGGGQYIGGGGGAGGYRTNQTGENSGSGSAAEFPFDAIVNQAYRVTVGAGGAGGVINGAFSTNGNNSLFSALTSIGGGRGAGYGNAGSGLTFYAANTGGAGGGGTYAVQTAGAAGTSNQGYKGGDGGGTNSTGGGGGALNSGSNSTSVKSGDGGSGIQSNITGTPTFRAGGGGGGDYDSTRGSGGAGGGGNGGSEATGNPTAGSANTGGGGGGAGNIAVNQSGANGGSGVVILKVPNNLSASFSVGVTQTSAASGSFTVYTITAAGESDTVTFN